MYVVLFFFSFSFIINCNKKIIIVIKFEKSFTRNKSQKYNFWKLLLFSFCFCLPKLAFHKDFYLFFLLVQDRVFFLVGHDLDFACLFFFYLFCWNWFSCFAFECSKLDFEFEKNKFWFCSFFIFVCQSLLNFVVKFKFSFFFF